MGYLYKDKFKFSIDYPASNIDTDFHTEAGDILYLTLGMDYSTDEEHMGISISVFSTNMSSLSEMVDKAAKLAKATKESIDFYINTINKYTNENLV